MNQLTCVHLAQKSTATFVLVLRLLGRLALIAVTCTSLLLVSGCALGPLVPFGSSNQQQALTPTAAQALRAGQPQVEFVLPTAPTGVGGPTEAVFGPKVYTRSTVAPVTVTDTFNIPAGVVAPFLLRIESGAIAVSGAKPVTDGAITLNDVQIAGTADFGSGVTLIEKTISLTGGINTLSVRLTGTPGSALRLRILGSTLQTIPTSLTPNPLVVTTSATASLTATLSPPPQTAGNLSIAGTNTGVASAPTSVAFSAGQTSVVIPVSGIAQGNTTVTASLNGTTASATINVTPAPPTIASLQPASLLVTQGAAGTLTVTLTSAPIANTAVTLGTSAPVIASVPASITVPAGQVTASIPIIGVSPGTSQISASLNGSTVSSQITVNPAPPTVVSLLPTLSNVTLGTSSSITLTISAAQAGNTVVPINAGPPGIVTAPTQVIVPAGQTSTTVNVSATALGQAGVTASLNSSSASSVINVIAPPLAITSLAPSPFTMNVGAVSTFTVTINSTQAANTDVTLALSNPGVLQIPATVTIAQGQVSASFTATALATGDAILSASANSTSQSANLHVSPLPAAIVSLLPNPLPLQQGATGSLTVTLNIAQEAATAVTLASSNPTAAQVAASITIPPGQITASIPVNALTPGDADITATVTAAGNTSMAVASVQVTPPPPVVSSISAAALTLPKGTPGTLRVTVSRAPNSATAVTLTSSSTATASVPPTVNIAAGALFADFPVSANAPGQANITATLNGGSAGASITVAPPEVTTLTLSPQTPTAYASDSIPFSATATLTDGSSVNLTQQVAWLSSDNTTASIGNTGIASVLNVGQTAISASYTYVAAQSGQSVTVSANTQLIVKAPVALELAAPATPLMQGQSTTVTVTTADPAPAGGLLVTLTQSGTGSGSFPATINIPGGQNSTSFTFTAGTIGSVTLTATAPSRLAGMVNLTLVPAMTLTAINPDSGLVGSTVTLTGTGFMPTPAGNQVSFTGNVAAQVITATATQLTVTVPDGAQTGPVTVTNANGTASSAPINFTVQAGAPTGMYFIHPDHLNTPRLITNQAGTVVWRWDNSDPFGNNTPEENPNGVGNFTCNLRLPGQYFDRETKLHYNFFRDYDPGTGRYIQSDPIGLLAGINTYSYVNSRPITSRDPFGLLTLEINTLDPLFVSPGRQFAPGVTETWLDSTKCKCKQCGNEWKLDDCSAELRILVTYVRGQTTECVKRAEQEHVIDMRAAGMGMIMRAGERAENQMRAKTFATKSQCETESASAVYGAMDDARRRAENNSRMTRHIDGGHNCFGMR